MNQSKLNIYIALLRGVNVGGHGKLLMADLRATLEGLGLENVRTYLQSGNAVFRGRSGDAGTLAEDIGLAIGDNHGFTPRVLVLSLEELRSAMAANPYPEGESDPKSLHLFFLKSRPEEPDLEKLESLRSAGEKFELLDGVFYLHTPGGMEQSKLAAGVEKALGVPVTARNWRSVDAVLSLALDTAS